MPVWSELPTVVELVEGGGYFLVVQSDMRKLKLKNTISSRRSGQHCRQGGRLAGEVCQEPRVDVRQRSRDSL